MPATDLFYSTAERAVLPLVGGVLSPALGVCVLWYVRRRLRVQDTSKSRAFYFYRALAGTLMGLFVCHRPMTDAWVAAAALLGFVLLDAVETLARLWNDHAGYVAAVDEAASEDVGLDRERIEHTPVVAVGNVASDDFADSIFQAADVSKDRRKRRWMLAALLVVLMAIAIMDGLLLVCRGWDPLERRAGAIAAFYSSGLAMTAAVYGGCVHAKLHETPGWLRRTLVWGSVVALWSATLVAACVPLLAGVMPPALELSNRAFALSYGLALGVVLKLGVYYYQRKADVADRSQLLLGCLAFALPAAEAAMPSFWL